MISTNKYINSKVTFDTHLFSLDAGRTVFDSRWRKPHLALVLFPHNVQILGQPLMVELILAHVQVRPPAARRVETPVHGTVLQVSMHVAHEVLGREHPPTVQTLYAPRVLRGVQVWNAHPRALAETLVIHGEGQRALGQVRRLGPGPVQEGAAEALRVGLGDEAARGGAAREDALALQDRQLFRGAPRKKKMSVQKKEKPTAMQKLDRKERHKQIKQQKQ